MLRQTFVFRQLSSCKKKTKLLLQSTNRWYLLLLFIPPLSIFGMTGFADITPVADRTAAVQDAIIAELPNVESAANVTETQLATITSLDLRSKGITELKTGDFSGMSGLTSLNLFRNSLSSLPDDIFEGLTSLTTLRLGRNSIDPLPIEVTLEKVGENQFKVVVPTCSPADITIPISVSNGDTTDSVTTLTVNKANRESNTVTITRSEGTTDAVTVNITDSLPNLPQHHYGYIYVKDTTLPLEIISEISIPQVTPEPESPSSPIVSEPVPIEPKNTSPTFTEGDITVRNVIENIETDVEIGEPIVATDTDADDILTYALGGFNSESFTIDTKTGQLKTKAALDYEKKHLYLITVSVSDGTITDTISVIINVIDEVDTPIISLMPPVSDRTFAVKEAILDAVPDVDNADDITPEHLTVITTLDLRAKGISELKSGDLYGLTALTNLNLYGNSLRRLPTGIFEGLTSLSTVRLGGNIYDPLLLTVSIQQVDTNQFRLIIPTGAPFNVSVAIDTNNVTVSQGDITSDIFTSTGIPTIKALPVPPSTHFGYRLVKSNTCLRSLKVREAIVKTVPDFDDCSLVSDIDLALITSLNLAEMEIMELHGEDFAGMLSLNELNLSKNGMETLPDNIFKGLISLKKLNLSGNNVDPLNVSVYLEKVENDDKFKVLVPMGAPFEMVFPLNVVNGRTTDYDSTILIAQGKIEGEPFTIERTPNTLGAVTVDIDIPNLPEYHSGYEITKSWDQPLEIFSRINVSPVFSEGDSTSRTIAEMTSSGTNIGDPISATDGNEEVLTYSLNGAYATHFDIDSTNGQLKTKSPLDYETKSTYTLTITVSDGDLTDSIAVSITVLDVNEAPVFAIDSITRDIAENTAAGTNIGAAITATDPDGDTLSYSLGGVNAATFAIESATGQLKTKGALDYETKKTYALTITASDVNSLTDTVHVTVNITDISENVAPVFTDGETRVLTIEENTPAGINIGDAVSATDANEDTLIYTLGGVDKSSFSLDRNTGQLSTKTPLDYKQKSTYHLTITVSDGKLTDTINVTIKITEIQEIQTRDESPTTNIGTDIRPVNNPPAFNEGSSAIRIVAENTVSGENIGSPVAATDADNDDLTYNLSGIDVSSFNINSSTGQLQTSASLDYETKSSYSVSITVSDGKNGSDTINLTINISDVDEAPNNIAPTFSEGDSTARSIAENTGSGVDIGAAVSATDENGDTLRYSLSGTESTSFSVDSSSGQLRTSDLLDYETKSSYSLTMTVSDNNGGTDSISITITITDIDEVPANNAPVFTAGTSTTRTVAENTAADRNIGSAVTATDVDQDTLTYGLTGNNASTFSIVNTTGQIKTQAALNHEATSSYSITVTVSDGQGGSDSISVTINVTDVNEAPVFNEGTTAQRSIAENSAADTSIGAAVKATDPDDEDNLTYTLTGADAASFAIDDETGEIKTKDPLDFEEKPSYAVTVSVTDGSLNDSISVTINVSDLNELRSNIPPVFDDGTSTQRSVAENTGTNENIGSAVSATDGDDDDLTYTLGGTDAASFSIDSENGQLKTKSTLNHEEKDEYSVTITVNDGSTTVNISVTINVTDVNESPVFADDSVTRSIPENTSANTDIGNVITATDPEDDDLTYTLGGADASSFDIDEDSGQLKTKASLDFENTTSYAVTITATDLHNLSDTINVTIDITDVDENRAPSFTEGTSTTRDIPENTGSGVDIGSPVSAEDPDSDVLTYTLGGADASSFSINSATGQLRTKSELDFEDDNSYTVTITVSDSKLTDSITVTINITDVDENNAPSFTEGDSTTRDINENTASGINIGSPVSATDLDTGDTLTYTLGGTNAASFDIDSTSGQLKTKSALDFENKNSFSVTITVSDTKATDTITVTINITDVDENNAPSFTDGETTSRAIAENTAANMNIGTPVAATDDDSDTLTYSLSGTNAASFDIDSTSGQLKTKAALDYEEKSSYTVTITVSDTKATDTITVTINITDISDSFPLYGRSQAIQNIIISQVAAVEPDVDSAEDVTDTHLSAITSINLTSESISSLNGNDFDGFSAMTALTLNHNSLSSLPDGIFDELSSLEKLAISANDIGSLDGDVFDALTSLKELNLSSNKLSSLPDGVFDKLTSLEKLNLGNNSISSLSSDIFSKNTSLQELNLSSNKLSSLPDNLLKGLTSLNTLTTSFNTGFNFDDLIDMSVTLSKTEDGEFKAVIPTGAPFDISVRLRVMNGTITDGNSVTVSTGSVESSAVTVTRTADTTAAVTVDIRNLPTLPRGQSGYRLVKVSTDLPLTVIDAVGGAPANPIPDSSILLPNYPNPFNPETWIPYQLAKPSDVSITIYDVRGVAVRRLEIGNRSPGYYLRRSRAAHWDGRNVTGEKVAGGVYFYVFTAGDYSATRKMLIMK